MKTILSKLTDWLFAAIYIIGGIILLITGNDLMPKYRYTISGLVLAIGIIFIIKIVIRSRRK